MVRDAIPVSTPRAVIALLVARKLVRAQRFRRVSPDSWGRSTAARAHAIQSDRRRRWQSQRPLETVTSPPGVSSSGGAWRHGRPTTTLSLPTGSADRIGHVRRAAAPTDEEGGLPPEETCRSPLPPTAQLVSARYGPTVEFIPFGPLEYRVTIAVVVESFGRLLDDRVRSIPTWCYEEARRITYRNAVSDVSERGKGTCAPDANAKGAPKRSSEWFNNILYEMFKNINKIIATKLLNTKLMRSNIFNLVLGAKS